MGVSTVNIWLEKDIDMTGTPCIECILTSKHKLVMVNE